MSAQARRARRNDGTLAGILIALERIASRPWEPHYAQVQRITAAGINPSHVGGRIHVMPRAGVPSAGGYLRGYSVDPAGAKVNLVVGAGIREAEISVSPEHPLEVCRGVS